MTDVSGSILSTPPSPSGQGLFLNFPHMGYYSGSEYKAFISASGGFLFKADDNNLISFGQSVSGGDGSSTKSFVLKSDNVFLSGSNVNILGERFFLGGGSQFVSGSNGNIEISSSKFHVKPDGDIVVGKVNATEGSIGGFDIGSTQISSSNGTLVLNADGGITGSKFKLEGGIITSDVTIEGDLSANSISTPTGGSPKAQITSQGYAKFVSASIGGFDVSATQINSTNDNLILKSNGQITASAAKISGAITITGGASFDTINNLASGVTSLGQATASLESSVTSLGQATASLESSVSSLGEATASLQSATGSLQTNITNIGVGATASASAAQTNAQSYASDVGTGAAASASAAQSNAQSYASDVGTGAAASASAAQSNAQSYASDVGTGAAASASAAQTNAQSYASAVGTGAAASASAAQSNAESYASSVGVGATASASAAQTNAQNYAVGIGAGAAASSSAVQSNLNTVSSSTAERIMTDVSGSILDITPSPSGQGLFLNYPHMGFYDNSEFTAFISASGGFLFKADNNNLISFGQSVSGGDGSSTKSFVLKSDNVFLSGSNVNILGERFFLGGGSQFVSGSNGNIEISSSNFHLTSEGNVTMSGEITAAGGTIGGFTIGDDLDSTSGTLKLKGALGQITASAVSMSGAITATSGLIGGMKIESNSIESTADAGDGTTTIYTVTVNGSSKYEIDGVQQASLTLIPGNTYRFDQADDSNENHPLRFVQTSGGTDYYTTGVTTNGSPGSSGAYTQIAVTQATPTQLYYRCTAHSGMGGSITVDKTSPLILDGNSGQITGSRVLFDGGTIGGFEVASTQINSTNDNLILKSNGQITASAAKISGAITITSGASFDSLSALNQATASLESSVTSLGQATASLQSATGSLQTNIDTVEANVSGAFTSTSASIASDLNTVEANVSGAFTSTSASLASTIGTVSSSTAERIMTDISGSILSTPPSPSGEGLFLNFPHMGYYSGSEYKAFISASGGFLFKADDNNLISFGQSVSGGDGSSTKSFVLKSDNVFLSGSKVNILGERFFLGGQSQFVSGSNGNIEISSSKFHVQPDGDVVMNNITASNANLSGKVTATEGEIAGYSITDTKLQKITDLGNGSFTSMSFANTATGGEIGLISRESASVEKPGASINMAVRNQAADLLLQSTVSSSTPVNAAQSLIATGGQTRLVLKATDNRPTGATNFFEVANDPQNRGTLVFSGAAMVSGSLTIDEDGSRFLAKARTRATSSVVNGSHNRHGGFYLQISGSGPSYKSHAHFFVGETDGGHIFFDGEESNVSISSSAFEVSDSTRVTTDVGGSDASYGGVRIGKPIRQHTIINDGGMFIRMTGDTIAAFEGTNATIGQTTGTNNNVFVDSNSVDIRRGTQVSASFGTTTTIGPTTGKHIKIDGTSLEIKTDATTTALSASAAGLEMSGELKATGGSIGGFDIVKEGNQSKFIATGNHSQGFSRMILTPATGSFNTGMFRLESIGDSTGDFSGSAQIFDVVHPKSGFAGEPQKITMASVVSNLSTATHASLFNYAYENISGSYIQFTNNAPTTSSKQEINSQVGGNKSSLVLEGKAVEGTGDGSFPLDTGFQGKPTSRFYLSNFENAVSSSQGAYQSPAGRGFVVDTIDNGQTPGGWPGMFVGDRSRNFIWSWGRPSQQHLIISSSIFDLDTLNSNVNFKEEVEVHGSKGKTVIGGNFISGSRTRPLTDTTAYPTSSLSHLHVDGLTFNLGSSVRHMSNPSPDGEAHTVTFNRLLYFDSTQGGNNFYISRNSDFVIAGALSKGSGTFRIPHPDPDKNEKYYLQHSFVESPTRGDNIYRWQVDVKGKQHIIKLPDYYKHLNENDMVWINAVEHFGKAYGKVNVEQTELTIHTDTDGLYNVLLIGTRKDEVATKSFAGVEPLKSYIKELEEK
jgi:exonuclease VII small subunit